MRSRIHFGPLLGSIIAALACVPPDITPEVQQHASLLNETADLACQCPSDVGFEGYYECTEALGLVAAGGEECVLDAFEGHEKEALDYLSCANAALEDFSMCLSTNPGCLEGWYDDCAIGVGTALAQCPRLPTEAADAYNECRQ